MGCCQNPLRIPLPRVTLTGALVATNQKPKHSKEIASLVNEEQIMEIVVCVGALCGQ